MEQELIICIPGLWVSRTAFIQAVVTATHGEFMFAGGILAHPSAQDHVEVEFCEPFTDMVESFRLAGQGKLTNETLAKVSGHQGVAYLHFPLDIVAQLPRLLKFTDVLSTSGGIAVKLETSGIAHEWERWFSPDRLG